MGISKIKNKIYNKHNFKIERSLIILLMLSIIPLVLASVNLLSPSDNDFVNTTNVSFVGTNNTIIINSTLYLWDYNGLEKTKFGMNISKLYGIQEYTDEIEPNDIQFSTNGSYVYYLDYSETITQKYLNEQWNVSNASLVGNYSLGGTGGTFSFRFSDNGSYLYIQDINDNYLSQHYLSTAWDISTASYLNKNVEIFCHDFLINNNGIDMLCLRSDYDRIYQVNLSTAWNISTANYTGDYYDFSNYSDFYSSSFSLDNTGKVIYITEYDRGLTNDSRIKQHYLSTAWDISTANYTGDIIIQLTILK